MGKAKNKRTQRRKDVSLATMPEKVANRVVRGDMGATGQAMRHGLVQEGVTHIDDEGNLQESPNSMKRMRRIDLVEMYARKGVLNQRQVSAAKRLTNAWEGTMKTPPAIKEIQVDSSPKPDAFIDIHIDRVSKFTSVMKHVDTQYREIIDCVVLNNNIPAWLPKFRGPQYQRGIRHMQEALTELADNLDL